MTSKKLKKLYINEVPEGTRDFIFEEYDKITKLKNIFTENFELLGFMPVATPILEFYDVFDFDDRFIPQTNMLKLTDLDGRLLVIRPDNTAPIARMVSGKLSEYNSLMLYYSQSVHRQHPNFRALRTEEHQCGIEIIGGNSEKADISALITAFESLKLLNTDFKIEIGHAQLLHAIIKNFVDELQFAQIKEALSVLNFSALERINGVDGKVLEIVKTLASLSGGMEALDKARDLAGANKEAEIILNYLEKIYLSFYNGGYENNIIFDLGIVQSIDYYTGLVFKGYLSGVGSAILSGGRYDTLYDNFGKQKIACGFAISVSALSDIFNISKRSSELNSKIENTPAGIKMISEKIDEARKTGKNIKLGVE